MGLVGSVIASQYLYFVPYYNTFEYSGAVLRYNLLADFFDASSWEAYDASNTSNLPTKGFSSGTSKIFPVKTVLGNPERVLI